jgi:hypothetical protein
MELLKADGVEVDERRFKSSAGIDGLSEPFVCTINSDYCYWIDYDFNFQDSEYRIHIVAMYSNHARQLMCRVCHNNMYTVIVIPYMVSRTHT